jgi:hypothetical protein
MQARSDPEGRDFSPAQKVFFVIPFTVNVHGEPSEARDLLFCSGSKKQQIPRANPALRNGIVRVFPQTHKPARAVSYPVLNKNEEARAAQAWD